MTESPDLRRRRRRHSSSERARSRLLIAGAGLLVVAVIAGAIGFGLGTGFGLADGDAGSPSGVAAGSAQESERDSQAPSASALPDEGIRATRIRIPRLDIDLEIVDGDGIDAPIDKAAHYPGTAWPGGVLNNVYIYGHAQEGMFLSLWEAEVGDEVILGLEDGTQRMYRVIEVLPEVPWDALELLDPTPTEQLTLQTSTSYEPTSPKFVVIAVPEA